MMTAFVAPGARVSRVSRAKYRRSGGRLHGRPPPRPMPRAPAVAATTTWNPGSPAPGAAPARPAPAMRASPRATPRTHAVPGPPQLFVKTEI